MSDFTGTLTINGVDLSTVATVLGAKGKTFFVDPANGADGNLGSADQPMASILAAYNRCVDGRGDKVVLMNSPNSTSSTTGTNRLAAMLTWSKSNTHLIGDCAAVRIGQRSRITGAAAGNTTIPILITVSGSGCLFQNLNIYNDYNSTGSMAVQVTGNRNRFDNVNFQGMVNSTAAADTGSCSLNVSGGQENLFVNCAIGEDTIAKTAANAELLLNGGAVRNFFEDCYFPVFCSGGGTAHVFVNATSLDRGTFFKRCMFYNCIDSTSVTMAVGVTVTTSCGGGLYFDSNCSFVGATAISDSHANVRGCMVVPSAATSGLSVKLPA